MTKQFLQMAALLCTESESKTKTLRNCGINPKPWLILSLAYMYYLVPKEIHEYAILSYDARYCGNEFKMFWLCQHYEFLGCLFGSWLGRLLVLGWAS